MKDPVSIVITQSDDVRTNVLVCLYTLLKAISARLLALVTTAPPFELGLTAGNADVPSYCAGVSVCV